MDTWMRRLALHTGNLEFVTPYHSGKAAHQQAAAIDTAIRQVTELLNTTPADALARIERVRSLYPVLTVSEARRRVLQDHLYSQSNESVADWAVRELVRPSKTGDHRTVYVLGKPYHWRQDYTGQLKLAAGESPW